jgi:sugar/nucleoside kinase (ribokinase family)
MDLILYLPLEMPTECDLLGTGFVSTLDSSSAIIAHNAAILGLRVRFATLVDDDDFGRIALNRLAQAGVELSGAIVDPLLSTGVTIPLPHGAERHSLTSPGSISALTVEYLRLDSLAQARHLHLSSLYVHTGLHPGIVDLLRSLKRMGLTTSLDTNDDPENQWGPPLQEILPYLDLFMPNEREIRRMAGGCGLGEALQTFEDKVPTIVVKRGPQGCRIQHKGQTFDVPGVPVDPVDTIRSWGQLRCRISLCLSSWDASYKLRPRRQYNRRTFDPLQRRNRSVSRRRDARFVSRKARLPQTVAGYGSTCIACRRAMWHIR